MSSKEKRLKAWSDKQPVQSYPTWKIKAIFYLVQTLSSISETSPLDEIKQETNENTATTSTVTPPKPPPLPHSKKRIFTAEVLKQAKDTACSSLAATFKEIYEGDDVHSMALLLSRRSYLELMYFVDSDLLTAAQNANVALTALDILNYLDSKYIKTDVYSVLNLTKRYMRFQIAEGNDVRSAVEELEAIAGRMTAIGEPDFIKRKFQAIHLLDALPPSWEAWTLAFRAYSDLSKFDLDDIRAKVYIEADRRKAEGEGNIGEKAFQAGPKRESGRRYGAKGNKPQGPKPTFPKCPFCDRTNHAEKDCFTRRDFIKGLHTGNRAPKGNNPSKPFKQNTNDKREKPSEIAVMATEEHTGIEMASEELAYASTEDRNRWVIDSGATSHMSWDRDSFEDFEDCHVRVHIANKTHMEATGRGSVRLRVIVGNETQVIKMTRVLYIPTLGRNLFSTFKATLGNGLKFNGNHDTITFHTSDDQPVLQGRLVGNLMYIIGETTYPESANVSEHDHLLWHQRLGHINDTGLKKLANGLANGVKIPEQLSKINCLVCSQAKASRKPVAKSTKNRSRVIGDRFFCDLSGPISPPSYGGSKYMMTMTDDACRKTWGFWLKAKNEAYNKLDNFLAYLKRQFNIIPKYIRTDEGKEFDNKKLRNILDRRGIILETTAPYTPEWNGVAERVNRTIMSKARSFLVNSGLPLTLWAEAASHAIWVKNRSPTNSLDGITPHEMWTGEKSDLSLLRTFGCLCQVQVSTHKKKLALRTFTAYYIGHDSLMPDKIRLYKDSTFRIIDSRSVHFYEGLNINTPKYPTNTNTTLLMPMGTYAVSEIPLPENVEFDYGTNTDEPEQVRPPRQQHVAFVDPPSPEHPLEHEASDDDLDLEHSPFDPAEPAQEVSEESDSEITHIPSTSTSPLSTPTQSTIEQARLSPRANQNITIPRATGPIIDSPGRGVSKSARKYPTNTLPLSTAPQSNAAKTSKQPAKARKTETEKLKKEAYWANRPAPEDKRKQSAFIGRVSNTPINNNSDESTDELPDLMDDSDTEDEDNNKQPRTQRGEAAYHAADQGPEPITLNQARTSPEADKWEEAMKTEMGMLEKMKTFNLVPLPRGRRAIGTKWVYKRKLNPNGTINKYKARLVAKGFAQRKGVDYEATYASVATMASIRMILATCAAKGLEVRQLDVDSAYLNGEMDTEVFMVQPPGFVDQEHPDYVCKLNKTLYGLKQAGRSWNLLANEYLLELGFKRSSADTCIYVRNTEEGYIIVGLYVDDFIYGGTNLALDRFESEMQKRFQVKLLGPCKHILGIEVKQTAAGIAIHQTGYISKVLEELQMSSCNPSKLPISEGATAALIANREGGEPTDITEYRSIVGKTMYAMVSTRPDIAFTVGVLGRYSSNPKTHHRALAKQLLCYLKETKNAYLLFPFTNGKLDVETYSDADYAGADDRKSTSGTLVLLNGVAIIWISRKQSCVATSTTHAEYMSLTTANRETMWFRQLLEDIGYPQDRPTPVFEDNLGCILLSENHGTTKQSKHFDIAYHFNREAIDRKITELIHVPSIDQLADGLTKPMPRDRHYALAKAMSLHLSE